jgi:hypothetical protein
MLSSPPSDSRGLGAYVKQSLQHASSAYVLDYDRGDGETALRPVLADDSCLLHVIDTSIHAALPVQVDLSVQDQALQLLPSAYNDHLFWHKTKDQWYRCDECSTVKEYQSAFFPSMARG